VTIYPESITKPAPLRPRRNKGGPFSNLEQLSQTIADILRTALQHVMVLQNLARASFSIKRQLLQNDLNTI
jgi:ribonuclease PH